MWSIVSSKLRCAVCTYFKCVCVSCVSWQQLRLGAEFVSHKRFRVARSPKIPVQWSVSFQFLNGSNWSQSFISSPRAIAATRVIRQPKSTLEVARQPSRGGLQAGEASWPLVCRRLANQLALLSFFFTWSKEVILRREEKDFSTPTFQHAPLSCPFLVTVTMSFQSESTASCDPASCQIVEFSMKPNYRAVSSTRIHVAVVGMSACLSYFVVSSTYSFLCKHVAGNAFRVQLTGYCI